MSNSISNNDCMATFTTNYIPTKPGLPGSYQIPLGFTITPLAPIHYHQHEELCNHDNSTTSSSTVAFCNNQQHYLTEQEMIMCTKCLSYLNLYCHIIDDQTKTWYCPICKQTNHLPDDIYNQIMCSNIMNSQVVEYHQIAAGYDRIAGSKKYNNRHDVTVIVLDGNLSSPEVRSIISNLSSLFNSNDKKGQSSFFALIVYTSVVNVYQIGIQGVASADIYSIDHDRSNTSSSGYMIEEDDEYYVNNNQHETILEDLEDDRMYIGSWDQVQFCASAYFGLDVVDEQEGKANENLNHHIGSQENTHTTSSNNNIDSNNHKKTSTSRREMLRQKREARIKNEKNLNNLSFDLDNCTAEQSAEFFRQMQSTCSKKLHRKKRCTGEALSYGMSLALSVEERDSARLLLFTNGSPNIGQGNITDRLFTNSSHELDIMNKRQIEKLSYYFDLIGKEGFENGIAIDVFCGDNNTDLIGAQVLLALVNPSAGYLLSYTSFHEDRFKSDLEYVVKSTRMSWTKNQDVDSVRLGMASPNWMNVINGCLLDLRMPSYILPKDFNGCEQIDDETNRVLSNERAIFSTCASLASTYINNLPSPEIVNHTRTRLRFGRYDPQCTVSLSFEVDKMIPVDTDNFVYFQFITRYLNPKDTTDLITRVISQRVPILMKDNDYNFFNSLNENTISSVLGKEAAFRSMIKYRSRKGNNCVSVVSHDDIEDLILQSRQDLDKTVNLMSKAYFNFKKTNIEIDIEESNSGIDRTDPPELKSTFRKLHQFRRGIILSDCIQSIDDRFILRNHFLRMPIENAITMMSPVLWLYHLDSNGNVVTIQVPAETLSLWDDCVIAADCFDTMFVWSGAATLDSPAFDELRTQCNLLLRRRAKGRFPAPIMYSLKEGESMARRFLSRLVPSHGDKEDDQIKNFPTLGTLPKDKLQRLRSKFRFYDPRNDASFLHWFAMVSNQR